MSNLRPKQTEEERWETRPGFKCVNCEGIIYSSYPGEYVECGCGTIAIDQTPFYSRYVGDYASFIAVDRETGEELHGEEDKEEE